MTPYCFLTMSFLFSAPPQENEVPRPDTTAMIAALHTYELHHGRDAWSWQLLQEVRAQVYDPQFAPQPFPEWFNIVYVILLGLFPAITFIIIIGGFWVAWRIWSQRSTWRVLAWLIVWFVILFSFHGIIAPSKQQLVVIKADATILRQGNGLSYPPQVYQGLPIRLASGVEATVRTQRNNGWMQIILPGEKIGWVPSDSVYFIK